MIDDKQFGMKYDGGKPEMTLLPPWALESVAKVLTFGAKKYAPDNWKYVENGEYRYKNAAERHINEFKKGNINDPESGLPHLAHAICCLMFILDSAESGNSLAKEPTSKSNGSIAPPGGDIQISGTAMPTDYWKTISNNVVNYTTNYTTKG